MKFLLISSTIFSFMTYQEVFDNYFDYASENRESDHPTSMVGDRKGYALLIPANRYIYAYIMTCKEFSEDYRFVSKNSEEMLSVKFNYYYSLSLFDNMFKPFKTNYIYIIFINHLFDEPMEISPNYLQFDYLADIDGGLYEDDKDIICYKETPIAFFGFKLEKNEYETFKDFFNSGLDINGIQFSFNDLLIDKLYENALFIKDYLGY